MARNYTWNAVGIGVVLCLVALALSPRFRSWNFLRIDVGMSRQRVMQIVGTEFQIYDQTNISDLRRRLKPYSPDVDLSQARSIMIVPLGLDRLGLVVFSDAGTVMHRVLLRT